MTVLELAEHGPALSLPLHNDVGRMLAASPVVDATPDPDAAGHWRVRARGIVGVTTMHVPNHPAVTLRICPKIPVARLLFLLHYGRDPKGWRPEHALVAEERDLLPALARLFAVQADHAIRQGLLKGYRAVDETAVVIRGRIRTSDQVSRHHGRLVHLVEVTHDEYTTDIAENRLLRVATDVLLRLPGGVQEDVRGQLLRLRVRLAEVTTINRGDPPPLWRPTRLNARYHHALRLAGLVLRGASVENRHGAVVTNGFLFDMARVFEDFVTAALHEALADRGGYCVRQAGHHLDEHDVISIVPDFVRYAADGTPLGVADAKYKVEQPNADLYQMLAYCTALRLPEGHLVYAKGGAYPNSHRIRHAGVTIHQHAVELDQEPNGLLDDVRILAGLLG
jgi:5-methylcytosine-specific restriction enzyme subunit McrC